MSKFSEKFTNYFYGLQISEKYMSNHSQISSNCSQIIPKFQNKLQIVQKLLWDPQRNNKTQSNNQAGRMAAYCCVVSPEPRRHRMARASGRTQSEGEAWQGRGD
jgi:hypothetical protein